MRFPLFTPAWWLPTPHAQTLWAALLHPAGRSDLSQEQLELPDGDFVDLCWSSGNSGPLVMVLHGLEGSIGSPYAYGLLAAIHANGWRGVLMHFRGCSGRQNRLDRSYHSGDTGDIGFLVKTLRARFPGLPMAAVGFSLGGNALLKYLGESGTGAGLQAAAAVSVPYDLATGAERLNSGFSRVYQWHLLRRLRSKVAEKFRGRERQTLGMTASQLQQLTDFWKFDHAVTARLHGFSDVHDYYARSSSRQYLHAIRVPTLLIHARDDPFMTPAAIPAAAELADCVTLELSDQGGHVGFVSGSLPWRPRYWLEERIPAFLRTHIELAPGSEPRP
ncbi:MAG: alpha/beta hydrolase [Gammaproteobacteria bacterium RIFCSPLOWO2_02_FULL_61_13]|nr:MAG: alpha/beta hydrolase [Gammaproteobacteria bacterium RIFCSPLOWO2_02_FULL_61_13]HLA39166.1 hydrolase [Candidatus Glassbacteria bacterium]